MERRLAAILAADVVGYTSLVDRDEAGTIARLTQLRRSGIEPVIARHQGRVVKLMGDGLLVEFASVVEAIDCAMEWQDVVMRHNAGCAPETQLWFRIGVSLGDVIVEDDDLYGAGVNIAARLEALADPGGICVSDDAFRQAQGKSIAQFESMGEKTLKNLPGPVEVHRVVQGATQIPVPPAVSTAALLDRPSIAVLPFSNTSGDPDQEYFADGLTEDIITALSYWRAFPVIARNSVFAYKGKAVDARKTANDLGARFLLEGSVRKAGNQVRITALLVDADTGHQVWADRFDRVLDEIFTVQDEIARQLAAVVAPELERAEQRRIETKKSSSLSAWECNQKGKSYLNEFTAEGFSAARDMFEKAIALDPQYSDAFVGIFQTHSRELMESMTDDPEQTRSDAMIAAKQAVNLDEMNSSARYALGNAYLWMGDFDAAISELEMALRLNPSNALARVILGNVLGLSGQYDAAIAEMESGISLNPADPRAGHYYKTWLAEAYFCKGDDHAAAALAREAIRRRAGYPLSNLVLGCALACLGEKEAACAALRQCERDRPGYIQNWPGWDLHSENALNRFRDGLKKAGWTYRS